MFRALFEIAATPSSIVITGWTSVQVIALVTRTGWATDHGGMLAVRMERAYNTCAFYRDLKYLYFFLGLVALCSAIYGVCRFVR